VLPEKTAGLIDESDAIRNQTTANSVINRHGVRVLSVYLGRTATEMQERIYQMEGKPYRPELLLQPDDVVSVVVNALSPRTAEVTDISIRPMIKS
jgi:hypothetical protein